MKMYVTGVSAKIENIVEKLIRHHSKFGAIHSVSKTREYFLKNSRE